MEKAYIKLEQLQEVLLNLERSRQQEKNQLRTAKVIVKCLEVISTFNNNSDEMFLNINNIIQEVIPFDDVYIFKKNKHGCDIVYSKDKKSFKIQSDFLQNKLSTPRLIHELHDFHGLSLLSSLGGSSLIIPFDINEEEYILIYFNRGKSAFEKKHFKIAKEVSSIVKQAIVNHNLISKLVYADKMVSIAEFAAGIAHEINNPLTIIRAKNYSLSKKNDKGLVTKEDIEKCTSMTLQTVDRISRIINGLRSISRQVPEKQELESLSLKSIFDDVLGLCSEKFQKAHIQFHFNQKDEKLETSIYSEKIQLSQVFLNLLNNAFDAISNTPSPWVKIEIKIDDRFCLVRFIDSGKGINEDEALNIFKVFYTTKEVGEGTGLGLSISEGIMRKLNGNLRYFKLGENTCFEVAIPLTKA